MRISASSSTGDILREIGERLQTYRLQQNMTVTQLAERSGAAPRTINRTEAGENSSLETVVKLLRALGRLDALNEFMEPPTLSPIHLAMMKGHQRQRARAPRAPKPTMGSAPLGEKGR